MKVLFAALLLAATPLAAAEPPLLAKVAQDDLAAVEMGHLAEAQGLSARVRTFGRMLATDLGRHHDDVAALARARRIKMPPAPSDAQKADCAFMAQMKGAAFDEAFKARIIANHEKGIADYRALAASGDTELAVLAEQTLPVLERHLAEAAKL